MRRSPRSPRSGRFGRGPGWARSRECDLLADAELARALEDPRRDDEILDRVTHALEYGALPVVGPPRGTPGDDLAELDDVLGALPLQLAGLGQRPRALVHAEPPPADGGGVEARRSRRDA